MKQAILVVAVAALATGCGSSIRSSAASSASASAPLVQTWVSEMTDPAPGPVVTGIIAKALGIAQPDVVAAVFLLRHPAGNGATVWAFRAGELSSQNALERWQGSQQKCGASELLSLGGHDAVMIQRRFIDQCQPQYLVMLDAQTLAVITDDGAYAGNSATTPTVPYRPAGDIASLVNWLQNELKTVELKPGGTPQTNNG